MMMMMKMMMPIFYRRIGTKCTADQRIVTRNDDDNDDDTTTRMQRRSWIDHHGTSNNDQWKQPMMETTNRRGQWKHATDGSHRREHGGHQRLMEDDARWQQDVLSPTATTNGHNQQMHRIDRTTQWNQPEPTDHSTTHQLMDLTKEEGRKRTDDNVGGHNTRQPVARLDRPDLLLTALTTDGR
jgi:hypothetical protein